MSKFRGHDYRQDHFTTPRQCQGFYPPKSRVSDALVGRVALGIIVALLVLAAMGLNI